MPRYCDVSLPVPLDAFFTYALPATLEERARPGCRVIVPFGVRKLTGVVLECHDRRPSMEARSVLRLVDEEPALSPELLGLGRWIAEYYCAPLGETLRGMLPLASDLRAGRVVSLTPAGLDVARQLSMLAEADDASIQLLRSLESRPLSEGYLRTKWPRAGEMLKSLERKGYVAVERHEHLRDPLRARLGRLMAEVVSDAALQEFRLRGKALPHGRGSVTSGQATEPRASASGPPGASEPPAPAEASGFSDQQLPHGPVEANSVTEPRALASGLAGAAKLSRAEKRLLEYFEQNPGPADLAAIESGVKGATQAARKLAKAGIVKLWKATVEEPVSPAPVSKPVLNAEQYAALGSISDSMRSGQFHAFLLHGVTGSGKTEVYLHAIELALAEGKSALMLVPEIGLTPAVAALFYARFGEQVAILHSAFSDVERAEQWRRIRAGRSRVVVGTRSGVFAPVENLGLVVVDEEHDSSYKQEETPRYHGRDVAVVRAERAGATVVLGSATPCLESRYNAERGKYTLIQLKERIEKRPLPEVELIDMRLEFAETRKQSLFSRRLLDSIGVRVAAGEQVMVLLNRRGFSTFVACRSCGERIECRNCSVTLTYHRREQRLLCHYCDYAEPVPKVCPKCGGEYIYFLGSGSEKVEEHLHEAFPRARIARLDRDTVRGKRQYEAILNGFRERHFDILVGTQMIAKGHDIPNVTLVGVVSADQGLGLPDFRAAERTFQLLTQVAGRAGRGELPGLVLIQTLEPEHYAIRFARTHDYQGFYEKELNFRRLMHYPPFAALANILVRSEKLEEALRLSGGLGEFLKDPPKTVRVLGPAAAAMVKLKSEYRYQFLLKSSSRRDLAQLLKGARHFAEEHKWPATALVIDVDPLSLM